MEMTRLARRVVPVERSLFGFVVLGIAILMTACHSVQQSQPAGGTRAADEAAIRKADADWVKAAQTEKVDDWVAFYSKNAVLLPPNDKKVDTQEGIRKYIGELLAAPGLAINWSPAKVEVARSGELAYTQGSYTLTMNDAHGKPTTDQGKTLEIWKKQGDGSWKCIVDMWSSDLPPTA